MAGDEKQDPMSQPITRGELYEALETWAGALLTKIDERFARLEARMDTFATKKDLERFATKEDLAQLEQRLRADLATKEDLERFATKEDLARHANAMMEHASSQIAVLDDKYKDLPGRMERVERAVYKRTKRAASRSRAPRRR